MMNTTITGLEFLWLEITGKCNLICSHCYADSGPTKQLHGGMDLANWQRVILEAADIGCRKLQFIGGEPTLHPHLQTMIVFARDAGFTFVEVFTNGTRLTPSLVGCFSEFGVQVASSFYSNDPLVHDRITGIEGSWHRTVTGLNSLVKAGVDTRVGIIVMDDNSAQVDETTEFLHAIGIQRVNSDRLRGVGRGRDQLTTLERSDFGELCGQCWKHRLCVTNTGEAFPCVFSRTFSMGNVLSSDLATIVDSKALLDFRRRLKNDRSYLNSGCKPDCEPNEDCAPKWCNPDDGSCSPNDPDPDCGPRD